jgi:hypothetical protein
MDTLEAHGPMLNPRGFIDQPHHFGDRQLSNWVCPIVGFLPVSCHAIINALPIGTVNTIFVKLMLYQRSRLFVANRLDNVPCLIEHLNLRAPVASALHCVAER